MTHAIVTRRLRFGQANSSNLAEIADGEADLVLTSPPYFSPAHEAVMRRPLPAQSRLETVERDTIAFALSLRPVFVEIGRILKPGGWLILQTKDVRYAGWLIAITAVHREMVESLGLRMLTRLWWQPLVDSRRHMPPKPHKGPASQAFRVPEVEEFQVYGRPGLATCGGPEGIDPTEVARAQAPLWRMAGPGGRRSHPYQSPATVARRLIALYKAAGDLVVDPFAGSGAILEAALDLGRRAAGAEIDPVYAARAERRLASALRRQRRARRPALSIQRN